MKDFSNKIEKLSENINSALYPNSANSNPNRIGAFGGESAGFAHGVESEYARQFYQIRAEADPDTVAAGMTEPVPRSIFNQYALFNFRGMYGQLTGSKIFDQYFDDDERAAMGGAEAKNVSIAKLINFFGEYYPRISYRPQDFIYAKYYKKIPVNHLVTLRRFPLPVNDNIFDYSVKDGKTGQDAEVNMTAGVTAITYLGETAGNKLDDILKFSFGLNWKEIEAKMEAIDSGDGGYTSQPFYSKIGKGGRAVADTLKGVSAGDKFKRQNQTTGDSLGTTYANFVLGPVNVIDKTNIRDKGLKFSNDVKLNFEYELKSLNYVNPKIAMIDIISNMLTMTTNNAQFFGGGQRYYGSAGSVASQFGDISKLKNGDFGGYIGSVVSDVETGFKDKFGGGTGDFSLENIIKGGLEAGKTLLGNMLGSFLGSQVGNVSGTQATAALISAEPTGDWHITVGNPLNPIVMMGNMFCDNATMTLGHGLGYDDFPMEVKFEIDLKHGKPRDKGDIENMFNAGRGRIYTAEPNETIINYGDKTPYGTVAAGTSNLQNTQSDTNANKQPASGAKNSELSNIKKSGSSGSNTTANGTYITNLVNMTIKS